MDTYLGYSQECGRLNLNKYTNKELNNKHFPQKGTRRASENVRKMYTNLSKKYHVITA